MAIVVEDGSVVAGANSYASVAQATTYLTARNRAAAWTAKTTAEQEAALVQATDYLTQQYRGRWKGLRYSESQSLDWPRAEVTVPGYPVGWSIGVDEVPGEVNAATILLAERAIAGVLLPDTAPGAAVRRQKVGSLEVEYDNATTNTEPVYNEVYRSLRHLLTGGTRSAVLERA